VDKGFQVERLLTVDLPVSAPKYENDALRAKFFQQVLAGVEALPGVRSAGLNSAMPLQGETWVDIIWLPGDTRPIFERLTANIRFISPGYFKTLDIPVRAGRTFEERDRNKDVAVISQRTADKLWPGQDAIGKRFYRGDERLREVIGVVGDIRTSLQQGPVVTVYRPYWEETPNQASLLVRTSMDPIAIARAVRREVWNVDSEIPVAHMRTMKEVISEAAAPRRFQMLLVLLFAVSALMLASLGVYGVVSYTVAQRTNEIGIRVALGARSVDVYRMVLRQGLTPVLLGLTAGVAGALALGRLLRSLLFEVSPADPFTIGTVVVALMAVAAFACTVPALRATHVDPITALRYE
jgi:predicted permease